jgi:hypothetical protein
MADSENHTLRLLRELRDDLKALDCKIDALDSKVDWNHEEVKERTDRLRQAMVGESILGALCKGFLGARQGAQVFLRVFRESSGRFWGVIAAAACR